MRREQHCRIYIDASGAPIGVESSDAPIHRARITWSDAEGAPVEGIRMIHRWLIIDGSGDGPSGSHLSAGRILEMIEGTQEDRAPLRWSEKRNPNHAISLRTLSTLGSEAVEFVDSGDEIRGVLQPKSTGRSLDVA